MWLIYIHIHKCGVSLWWVKTLGCNYNLQALFWWNWCIPSLAGYKSEFWFCEMLPGSNQDAHWLVDQRKPANWTSVGSSTASTPAEALTHHWCGSEAGTMSIRGRVLHAVVLSVKWQWYACGSRLLASIGLFTDNWLVYHHGGSLAPFSHGWPRPWYCFFDVLLRHGL